MPERPRPAPDLGHVRDALADLTAADDEERERVEGVEEAEAPGGAPERGQPDRGGDVPAADRGGEAPGA